MGKQQRRRPLTGLVRRDVKRRVNSNRRCMSLSGLSARFRTRLHRGLVESGSASSSAMIVFMPMCVMYALLLRSSLVVQATAVLPLLCAQYMQYARASSLFISLFRLDHELHDIPEDEENNHNPHPLPRQDIRFDSWTNQQCYANTGFTKVQLIRIYDKFELAARVDANGSIRVNTNPNGPGGRNHLFHPEELFLFMMMTCHTGMTHKKLCEHVFGGNASRWSFGYPWILRYVDTRYRRTLSHEKLRDYVQDFPYFYHKISLFLQKMTTRHNNDGTAIDRPGLNFCPWRIFGFIDCSIDKISRPMSGPAGDYIGAPRRPGQYVIQRSVYTAYKKFHGIKVETVLLPNGITTLYGPVSARIHDVGGVLLLSNLDNFLWNIQTNMQFAPFSAFGDSTYGAQHLRCIRSYFFPLIPGIALTPEQDVCNNRIKPARQTIEHCYGELETNFRICTQPSSMKLCQSNPYAIEQLRVCHLLSNIYTCLNGNKCSLAFDCTPPSLDDYLVP